VFDALKSYNLRLNTKKCTLSVEEGKFLGFMLTHKEIEANPDKCREIADMCSFANMKEIQRLMGRLTSLSRFIPKLAKKTRPIIFLMKKEIQV